MIHIANFFDMNVPTNAKKQELKELLFEKLIERGVLSEPAPAKRAWLGDHGGIPAPLSPKGLPVRVKPDGTAEELGRGG